MALYSALQPQVLTKLFRDFFESEKAGGILLLVCTVLSLITSNTVFGPAYIGFWEQEVYHHSVKHWINDGLMTVFFLLIGLELEREIYKGELSNLRNAWLPVVAGVGGMLFPAVIHLSFSYGSPDQSGAGIPMATDIAFAIGILSLLGSRVPVGLRIFLVAFAIIDDLGAILVISLFYSSDLSWMNLALAMGTFGLLMVLNRLRMNNLLPYLAGGVLMWYFMLHSGVHPAIAGVLLAFAVPFGDGSEKSPSYILQHLLHKPVAFFVLPLFALANTSISLAGFRLDSLTEANSLGILTGLVLGKPVGIILFAFLAVKIGVTQLPAGTSYRQLLGIGLLGGIGFTMSIFITLLAFSEPDKVIASKVAVMLASLVAGTCGLIWLWVTSLQQGQAAGSQPSGG